MSELFLKFWGEKKSRDWYVLEFHGIQRQRDETISMFNRIFSSLYYKMPKAIQPPEVVARLCSATTFHLDLTFLLMERRFVTLQHIFDDAQEIEDNFQAY